LSEASLAVSPRLSFYPSLTKSGLKTPLFKGILGAFWGVGLFIVIDDVSVLKTGAGRSLHNLCFICRQVSYAAAVSWQNALTH
jgi:hypothetical protein